jgi:phosphoribosylanthranilate isomerase
MPSSANNALDMITTVSPDCVQLHSSSPVGDVETIRNNTDVLLHQVFSLPVQASVAEGNRIIEEAGSMADSGLLDGIVLDTGSAYGGGSGKVHDWDISRQIISELELPVIMAGGLTPGNVAACVRYTSPYGVDVASGVEKNGQKDRSLVCSFIENARLL